MLSAAVGGRQQNNGPYTSRAARMFKKRPCGAAQKFVPQVFLNIRAVPRSVLSVVFSKEGLSMRICCGEHASETIAFAGEELRSYLDRMTVGLAEDWEIRLCVCEEAFPGEKTDCFRVEIGDDGGSITANNARSVLLGAYDYLHFLGCRFLMPQKVCEVVPHVEKDGLCASYEKKASFFHRGVCIEGADSFDNIMSYIEWLPKVGYNSFFLQFKSPYAFLSRWYHHEENPYAEKEPYSQADALRDMEQFEQAAKKRGLLLHKAGHGWTGEVLGYETVSWNAGQKEPKDDRTCRMAMIDGERKLFGGVPANTNLCYHNKEAVDAFVSLVVDYAAENPRTDYLHVWLADEYNNLCECPDCRKTTLSDQYVEILNEIDRRLTEAGLATRIVFLLYQELLWPPVEKRLLHPERFVLMFAPISRTFQRSYELGSTGKELPVFVRNRVTLPTSLAENMAFLAGWQAVFDGDGFVYDYPLGRAHYGDFGYVHIAQVIHDDIQKLKQMGLDGYISCQELRAAFPNALPNYMMAYTLFDENAVAEDVITEYFAACYGEDWPVVLQYLTKLSDFSDCDYVNGKGERKDTGIAESMEHIKECCTGFAAEILRHKNAEGSYESFGWKLLEYHRNYSMLFADALCALACGEKKSADEKWEKLRDYICEKEPEYQPYLDVYRILEVTKKYTGLH